MAYPQGIISITRFDGDDDDSDDDDDNRDAHLKEAAKSKPECPKRTDLI